MALSKLTPMRYKNFIWPHNPRTYTIGYERRMASHDIPHRKSRLEAMGMAHRVMRGEGEFFGPDAYEQFKALATVFYDDSPGVLVHPVWQTVNAYFVELTLKQEPRADYVRYAFTFWECGGEETAFALREIKARGEGTQVAGGSEGSSVPTMYHTVVRGDTLWDIARTYGVEIGKLIGWNPQIKNPNLILPGQKVRVSE